jgi:hypothetical protein
MLEIIVHFQNVMEFLEMIQQFVVEMEYAQELIIVNVIMDILELIASQQHVMELNLLI